MARDGRIGLRGTTTLHEVDEVAVGALESTPIDEKTTVVVADRSDRRNLLLAGLVKSRFDVNRVIACVNDPTRLSAFETQTETLTEEFDVPIDYGEIVSHDTKRAIVNFAAHRGVATILTEHEPLRLRSRLIGDPIDWVVQHAPCDVVLVDGSYDDPDTVHLADDSPDSTTVAIADSVAAAAGGTVAVDADAAQVRERLTVPVGDSNRSGTVVVHNGATNAAGSPDNAPTALTVYPHESNRPGVVRRLVRWLT